MSVEYDPFSADVTHGDNHAIYKRLRDESPLHFMEKWNAWALRKPLTIGPHCLPSGKIDQIPQIRLSRRP